jgi:hypothetical protein
MNLKRIIREELDGLEWIKDTKSNQDIAQEIADETKIKNGKLYPPFLSSHTSLSSPLFILSPSPLFRNYGEEQYGLNKEDANDVWKRYGKLLKNKVNNLNESNELEWIKDTNSNQDIAQEIADETKIKNDLLHPPFTLSHPFKSHVSIPLHSLPLFLSHFSSFPLLSSSFTKYGKEQYGLNKEDANDVWERYKKLIENKVNNLNESNDLQWIKDVKSDEDIDEDIAQELVNNTKIVKDANGNFTIEADNFRPYPIEDFAYDYAPHFIVQIESNYGITDINHISKIWKRYQEGIGVRTAKEYPIGGVNESNDFSWIDEIPQYDFYNGEYYIDISELDDDEACEVQQAILNIGIDWKDSMGLQKRFCDTRNTKGYIIKNATLYRTPRTFKEYEEAIYPDIIYINGRTDLLA